MAAVWFANDWKAFQFGWNGLWQVSRKCDKKGMIFFCMYRSNQNTDQILLSVDWVDSDIPVI